MRAKPVVIVTGGTQGLGKAISLQFGNAGYEVIAIFRSDTGSAKALEAEFARLSIRGRTLQLDLEHGQSCERLLELAGTLAADDLVVIHNACARFQPTMIRQLDWRAFEQNFAVAVHGAFSCAQAFLPVMAKNRKGTFIAILSSSTHGLPPKGFGAYHAAKHALLGFIQSLAVESALKGMRIFSVSPQFMHTPLTQSWDSRFVAAMTQSSGQSAQPVPVDDPASVAKYVLKLTLDPSIPGRGEDYRTLAT
ncbi:MAG: SDR family oxidoreductase [Deltaproteobacteria bacterium]|nr:SDR family oxidoreductase [Deltaproteobacteria bacterium]